MIFDRAEDGRFPSARLVLWPETTGFSVPNIVPVEMGELSTENYNGLLEEFASLIAIPVAERFGWQVSTTSPTQGLDDWLDEELAAGPRRFTAAANQDRKSTVRTPFPTAHTVCRLLPDQQHNFTIFTQKCITTLTDC